MYIRKTTIDDLEAVLSIYHHAREYMKENNNPDQWKNTNPTEKQVIDDISNGHSFVCVDEVIVGVFYFNKEVDPTYLKIDGAWINDEEYGVIHRIAVGKNQKGVGTLCIKWVIDQCDNVRIDTHHDNIPMKNLLNKLGFQYCGIIELLNKEKRMAYQYCRNKKDS